MPDNPTLTIFADGRCPLCVMEMKHLKAKDKGELIAIEDINALDFSQRFPDIDVGEASRVLHGRLATGELLLGLDVSHKAWTLVGRKYYLMPLRWPLIKIIADIAYKVFAKHRYSISKLLTGKARLENCDSCHFK